MSFQSVEDSSTRDAARSDRPKRSCQNSGETAILLTKEAPDRRVFADQVPLIIGVGRMVVGSNSPSFLSKKARRRKTTRVTVNLQNADSTINFERPKGIDDHVVAGLDL